MQASSDQSRTKTSFFFQVDDIFSLRPPSVWRQSIRAGVVIKANNSIHRGWQYHLLHHFVTPNILNAIITFLIDDIEDRTTDASAKPPDSLYPEDEGPLVKADALGFNSSCPLLIEPTSCFGFDITILGGEDAFLAAIDQDTTVAVTSTSATTEFFTDSQCQTKGSQIAMPNGSSYGSLYARDNNPGTFDLKVTAVKGSTLKPVELKAISG